MDAVFLTMGGILIPLGFYLKIEHSQDDLWGTACVIFGLLTWLMAYLFVKHRGIKEQKEKIEATDRENQERTRNGELLSDILRELKRFNSRDNKNE